MSSPCSVNTSCSYGIAPSVLYVCLMSIYYIVENTLDEGKTQCFPQTSEEDKPPFHEGVGGRTPDHRILRSQVRTRPRLPKTNLDSSKAAKLVGQRTSRLSEAMKRWRGPRDTDIIHFFDPLTKRDGPCEEKEESRLPAG